jgi:glutathione S-transferase
MHYTSVADGRKATGLRLVLTAGVPGPWSEAAKAILRLKGLDFLAVAQEGGGENPELLEWTGQAGAPVAVNGDEQPATDSIEILFLAERLEASPPLIPADALQRARMFGMAREIIGRRGLGWDRRLMMLGGMISGDSFPEATRRLAARYDFNAEEARQAPARIAAILRYLSDELHAQQSRKNRYLIGDTLTAADIYWACFSNMFLPLPHEQCPMPGWLRASYGDMGEVVARALDPALIEHRDFIYAQHIGLPLDFVAEVQDSP